MLINTYKFIFIFLPSCIFFYYLINKKYYKYSYLSIFFFSLIFYGIWNLGFLILILISIFFNYQIGSFIKKNKSFTFLIIGILIQVVILGYFKYKNFFLENINLITDNNFKIEELILPLGISFFTFKHILFLVECYKDKSSTKYNFLEYSTYITFFPHLIAGPLSKPKEIIPQLIKNNPLNYQNLNIGLTIFLIGLFKKIVLADTFAGYVDDPFNATDLGYQISFYESWLAMLCFSLQIYFDFSGYTDMAIGLAKIFGVSFPINFFSPYKSKSIIEFWKTWHMTLSRFLKECIYIPLGGNRKGTILSFIFIIITMLIGGLWHGASWNFVCWGLFHAILIIINHILIKINFENKIFNFYNSIKIFLTFLFVSFGWVIFKLQTFDSIMIYFKGLTGLNGFVINPNLEIYLSKIYFLDLIDHELRNIYYYGMPQLLFILIGLIMIFFLPNTHQIMQNFKPFLDIKPKVINEKSLINIYFKFNLKWAVFVSIIGILAVTGLSNEINEFIYYQF